MAIFELLAGHGMMMSGAEIANELGITSQHVYRSLMPLRELGLVRCVAGRPRQLFVCRPLLNAKTVYISRAEMQFARDFAPVLSAGPLGSETSARPLRWRAPHRSGAVAGGRIDAKEVGE